MTDANVVLGRLNPEYFVGGKLALDPRAATRRWSAWPGRLGGDAGSDASSMGRITSENMANAVRLVSAEEGSIRATAARSRSGAPGRSTRPCSPRLGIDRVVVPLNRADVRVRGAGGRRARRRGQARRPQSSTATRRRWRAGVDLQARAVADLPRRGQHRRGAGRRPDDRECATGPELRAGDPGAHRPARRRDARARPRPRARVHHEFYGYRLAGPPVELIRLLVTARRTVRARCRPSRSRSRSDRRPRGRRGPRDRRVPRRRGVPADAGRRASALPARATRRRARHRRGDGLDRGGAAGLDELGRRHRDPGLRRSDATTRDRGGSQVARA